jgi:hypothetical protein
MRTFPGYWFFLSFFSTTREGIGNISIMYFTVGSLSILDHGVFPVHLYGYLSMFIYSQEMEAMLIQAHYTLIHRQ